MLPSSSLLNPHDLILTSERPLGSGSSSEAPDSKQGHCRAPLASFGQGHPCSFHTFFSSESSLVHFFGFAGCFQLILRGSQQKLSMVNPECSVLITEKLPFPPGDGGHQGWQCPHLAGVQMPPAAVGRGGSSLREAAGLCFEDVGSERRVCPCRCVSWCLLE